MPTYEIAAPNGKTYRINGPEGASDEQVRAEVLRQFPEAERTGDFTPEEEASGLTGGVTDTGDYSKPSMGSILGDAARDVAADIGKGMAWLPDTLAAGGRLAERGIVMGGATVAEPVLRGLGATGAADVVKREAEAARAGTGPYKARRTLGEMFEETAANAPGRPYGLLGAQFLGGALWPVPGVAAKPRPTIQQTMTKPAPVTEGGQIAQAAERIGARVMPADVGGPATRRLTALAAQTPLGAGPVVRGAREAVGSVGEVAGRTAASAGRVLDTEGAGELVQRGAQAYIKRTSSTGGRLYKKAEQLARGAMVNPTQANKVLDDQIATLSETPSTNAAALGILNDLKADLAKSLSVSAVRNLRTDMRARFMKEGLRGSALETRVGQILDAASDDITSSLPKDAASAYRNADKFWKQRVEQIDTILAPVIGKKGEKSSVASFQAIERMARGGDSKQLSRLLSSLPEEDAGAVTATIIDRLGQAAPGAQDAVGGVFSPSTFLTNWNKLSPRAKNVLFSPEQRNALNDLATVTSGMKGAARYANVSQTGGVVASLATGGALTQFFTAPVSTTAFLAGQYGLGRLMSSPAYVRWLTRGAKLAESGASESVLRQHVGKLGVVAASNPSLRADIAALMRPMNDDVGVMAAASDSEEN